jgi:rare lipoprotein A
MTARLATLLGLAAALAGALSGCSVGFGMGVGITIPVGRRPPQPVYVLEPGESESGEAAVYGRRWAGKVLASGDIYDPAALTCAHRTLPMGSELRVRRLEAAAEVVVRVNDRAVPRGCVVMLSRAAADNLGLPSGGSATVALKVLK